MNEKTYINKKSKGIKIYKIWLQGSVLHKKDISYKEFDRSWTLMNWINTCTVFDTSLGVEARYVSEDQMDKQIQIYYNDLKKSWTDVIKDAQKHLDKIEIAINKANSKKAKVE